MAAEGFLTIGVSVPSIVYHRGEQSIMVARYDVRCRRERRTIIEEQQSFLSLRIFREKDFFIEPRGILSSLFALKTFE